jgi:IclR family transcriptional regulator, pca regulon regulatory protein
MGRVLLAAQPDERLDEYLASVSLRGLTGHTITSATALRRELRKIRAQGWALVDQELEEGLRSIAAPIRDADDLVVAAVNVSTHAERRSLDNIAEELLQPLLTTARRIEVNLAPAPRPVPTPTPESRHARGAFGGAVSARNARVCE